MTIRPGDPAPPVVGVNAEGPHALLFFKVTCPTCQMAAAPLSALATAYPGHVVAVGQDPAEELAAFAEAHAMTIPSVSDVAPYPASDAYGIEHVPTLVVVDGDGTVAEVVESWDREGLNRAAGILAERLSAPAVVVSTPGDGLPDFRPG